MNISSVGKLADLGQYAVNSKSNSSDKTAAFEDLFQAAMNQINDTNNYSNEAKEAETAYAMGLTDNTTDLLVAQQKANMSLQYTVAIRNSAMDAYKEIMNLQF